MTLACHCGCVLQGAVLTKHGTLLYVCPCCPRTTEVEVSTAEIKLSALRAAERSSADVIPLRPTGTR